MSFPIHTAKNPFYYSQNKYLKTSHCKLSVLKQEKTPQSALTLTIRKNYSQAFCRYVFRPCTVKNPQFTHISAIKMPQLQAICSQTGKNATSRQLCRAVFTLYALSKISICTICPNNWAYLHTVPIIGEKSTINFSSKFSLLNQFLIFSAHCPNNFG